MRSRPFASVPFAAVAALALACGGSDSSTETGGPGAEAGAGGGGHAGGTSAGAGGANVAGHAGNGSAGAIGGGAAGAIGGGKGGAKATGGAGGAAGNTNAGGAAGAAGNTNAGGAAGSAGNTNAGGATAGNGAGGNGTGGTGTAGAGGGAITGGSAGAGGACSSCQTGFICKYGTCIPPLGTCTKTATDNGDNQCPGDSYCDADGLCVPYGVPPTVTNDPDCQKPIVPTGVTPELQCEWTGEGGSGGNAAFDDIYSTPVVADLNLDGDPDKLQPSIVVTTFHTDGAGRTGMLRIFDGRTCTEQLHIGGQDDPDVIDNRANYGAQWAIGDLDGDVGTPTGHPEIVGLHRVGQGSEGDPAELYAFHIVGTGADQKLERLWFGHECKDAANTPIQYGSAADDAGPGLWDLDGDGAPEVLLDKQVYDGKTGCLLNDENFTSYSIGLFSAVADVDLDGLPDLVRFDGVYGWDVAGKKWVLKPWVNQSTDLTTGNIAIANVGFYSTLPNHPNTDPVPEVIVVASGLVRIQTLDGKVVFGPYATYSTPAHQAATGKPGGTGGPPTASDFDGDGQVEFATAGAVYYTVYDPDCVPGADATLRPGGTCTRTAAATALPKNDGILWAQESQDLSSNVTGSSIFDFDGDGIAEAVYGDECFLRVYEGTTGEVVYSASASSGTGYEYPVMADVDGDYATEIVATRTGGVSCPATDPLDPKVPFKSSHGFEVLRDPQDRWASSRPIWNQYAYSITNVNDDATIPKKTANNWQQPGLNNYRQNAQGSLGALKLADLTVELTNADQLCAAAQGTIAVQAVVCNRGTNPVQDGALIAFDAQKKAAGGTIDKTPICTTTTSTLLKPGDCTTVGCSGSIDGDSDIGVTVDPMGVIADCHPGNNVGASARVLCGKP